MSSINQRLAEIGILRAGDLTIQAARILGRVAVMLKDEKREDFIKEVLDATIEDMRATINIQIAGGLAGVAVISAGGTIDQADAARMEAEEYQTEQENLKVKAELGEAK